MVSAIQFNNHDDSVQYGITPVDLEYDSTWLNYFSPATAYRAVASHVKQLPSSRNKEKHTMRVYESGLNYFLKWNASLNYPDIVDPDEPLAVLNPVVFNYQALPTPDLMMGYVGHLVSRDLASSTISCKYLAPVRHYLKALARQDIRAQGSERDFVQDCKEQVRLALDIKNPPREETNYLPALYQHGERLTQLEVNTVFMSIERESLMGKRDLALTYLGFTSGLRVAELCRLTLAKIRRGEECYTVHVRGKRNNMTPVAIDLTAVSLISSYIEAWNKGLPEGDERRIDENTPIWQPLIHGDNYPIIDVNGYSPDKGMSSQGIRGVIHRRVKTAVGREISPHDMRRTVAAIASQAGMRIEQIQQILRHKDPGTTLRYVGKPPKLAQSLVSNYIQFSIK